MSLGHKEVPGGHKGLAYLGCRKFRSTITTVWLHAETPPQAMVSVELDNCISLSSGNGREEADDSQQLPLGVKPKDWWSA